MKTLIKAIKDNRFSVLLGIFALLGTTELVSMKRKRSDSLEELNKKEHQPRSTIAPTTEQKEEENGWYVYGAEGEQHKILIDEETLKLSRTIKNMLDDIGPGAKIALPLTNLSIMVIKNSFNLVRLYNQNPNAFYQEIHTLPFDELLTILACIDYLELPEHFKNAFVTDIKNQMTANTSLVNSPQFTQLDSGLQKLLIFEPTTHCLTIKIIEKNTEKRKINLIGHPQSIVSVAFSPDSTKIASGSDGSHNNLIVWNDITGKPLFNLVGHDDDLFAVAFSPDGTKIVSTCSGYENHFIVWNAITGKPIFNLDNHSPESVVSVAFSPDGTKMVSGSTHDENRLNNLIVWDTTTGQEILDLAGHPHGVYSVAFSPDGTKIVSGCLGNQDNLIVWDAITGKRLFNLVGHPDGVLSVAFSPDGTKIISSCYGNRNNLIVWNAITGQPIFNLVGHPHNVFAVAFSPDGTKIVSGCDSNHNNLIVWDATNGNWLFNLIGHSDNVRSVAFSPDGTKIISAGAGNRNNLIVWNAMTGQPLGNLVGHPNSVEVVKFSPDGTKIVSGSQGADNNLIVWTILTNQEEIILKNIHRLTAPQIRLLYQLCLQPSKGSVQQLVGNDRDIFNSLPRDTQNVLNNLF